MITINDFIKMDGFEEVNGAYMIVIKKIEKKEELNYEVWNWI